MTIIFIKNDFEKVGEFIARTTNLVVEIQNKSGIKLVDFKNECESEIFKQMLNITFKCTYKWSVVFTTHYLLPLLTTCASGPDEVNSIPCI